MYHFTEYSGVWKYCGLLDDIIYYGSDKHFDRIKVGKKKPETILKHFKGKEKDKDLIILLKRLYPEWKPK